MRFLLGVVVASVACFVWAFVFWGISPYPSTVIQDMPNRDIVAGLLKANIPEDGVYMIPGFGDPNDPEWAKRNETGPHVTLLYHGGKASSTQMLMGYLHMLGSVFLLAVVLATAGRRTFWGRFMLTFWIGLFVAIWSELSDVVWYYYPIRYACLNQTFHLSSILIVGLILAFFVRPPADPELD